MTDLMPYFIGCGFLVVIIIVFNHRKQKSRLDRFVKDGEEAPSMLMVQSVDRKLKNIYSKLYQDGVKPEAGQGSTATGRKLQLIKELEALEVEYAAKKLSLREYSDRLQQLQLKTSELK